MTLFSVQFGNSNGVLPSLDAPFSQKATVRVSTGSGFFRAPTETPRISANSGWIGGRNRQSDISQRRNEVASATVLDPKGLGADVNRAPRLAFLVLSSRSVVGIVTHGEPR